jgi:hypothetical protein
MVLEKASSPCSDRRAADLALMRSREDEESEQDETQQPSPAALLFMFWFVFMRLICFPRSLSLETVRAL